MGTATELNGGLSSRGTSGVLLEGGDGYPDGHNPDGVGVSFVEDSAESLDGLGDSEGRVLGEHLLVLADHLVGDLESTLKTVNNVRHDGIICDTQHNSIECHY